MADAPPPYPGAASSAGGGTDNPGYNPDYYQDKPVTAPPYQYPPQEYPAGAGYAETTPLAAGGPPPAVIYQSAIVWGRNPVATTCLHCNNAIVTSTQYVVGTFTWLLAALIFLVGGWLFCFLIPFCVDSFKDVRHYCPSCGNTIHVWNRLG